MQNALKEVGRKELRGRKKGDGGKLNTKVYLSEGIGEKAKRRKPVEGRSSTNQFSHSSLIRRPSSWQRKR